MSADDINDPSAFNALSEEEKGVVLEWIRVGSRMGPGTMTNGEFKGAMRECGFEPNDPEALKCASEDGHNGPRERVLVPRRRPTDIAVEWCAANTWDAQTRRWIPRAEGT